MKFREGLFIRICWDLNVCPYLYIVPFGTLILSQLYFYARKISLFKHVCRLFQNWIYNVQWTVLNSRPRSTDFSQRTKHGFIKSVIYMVNELFQIWYSYVRNRIETFILYRRYRISSSRSRSTYFLLWTKYGFITTHQKS